jgi:hypothetical protein
VYSAIKSWVLVEHKDMIQYPRLIALIKAQNQDYEAKHASLFTKEQLHTAWRAMPNDDPTVLVKKVASMLFWFGGLRAAGDGKTLTCGMVQFQPQKGRIKVGLLLFFQKQ